MPALTAEPAQGPDPYTFLALLGKQFIRLGGLASTDRLLDLAAVRPGERVLDIGCGVGITAIRLARDHQANVVAVLSCHDVREQTARCRGARPPLEAPWT